MKRLAVFLVVALGVLIGCMGGGGGGGGVAGSSGTLGHISGKLTLQSGLASVHASSTRSLASVQPGDAVVFLEENPSITAVPAADGSYRIDGIPFGRYYVLVRVRSLGGNTYKVRSLGQAALTADAPAAQVDLSVAPADVADRRARLLVYTPAGQAAANCAVSVWGEPFDPMGNGIYQSPYMPAGGVGNIFIEPPAGTAWERGVLAIPDGTFRSDTQVVIGTTMVPAGSTNHPPVVCLTAPLRTTEGNGAIPLSAAASDQDGDSLATSWFSSGGSFSQVASFSATWIAPADAASATVTFEARETSGYGPYLTSKAQFVIYVSPPGSAEIPGEITLYAPRKLAEITGTATAQIQGNTDANYIASITWPSDVTPAVSWTATKGTPTSHSGTTFAWRSPAISAGSVDTAVITLVVSDATTRIERTVSILISSLPAAQITSPTESQFEAGSTVAFRGEARDYQGVSISAASLTWYLATGSSALQPVARGTRDFSWVFVSRGAYQIALRAVDSKNVAATVTKDITVVNARPVVTISSPADQTSYLENVAVNFEGSAVDLEDGAITANDALGWNSSIDGFLASGPSISRSDLSAGSHHITLSARDSEGGIGTASITVRINLPPAMDFTPADDAAFFSGHTIAFQGVGTDTNGAAILPTRMTWFLDDAPTAWRTGIGSFDVPDTALTAGTHRVRLEGTGALSSIGSVTHRFHVRVTPSSITSPADETRVDIGTPVTLTATPSSIGALTMEWWRSWGGAGAERIGADTPLIHTFPAGRHTISYVGTDSQGVVSADSVDLIVENLPLMAFTPLSGSVFFVGTAIPFRGVGTDSDGLSPMPAGRMTWYIDSRGDAPWKTATASFDLVSGVEAAGARRVTLAGLSLLGGAIGSVSHDITIEYPLPEITAPASGTTFDPSEQLVLNGAPVADGAIPMQWWLDYDSPGRRLLGNTTMVSTDSPSLGWHYVSYIGTDTAGIGNRDDIMVLVRAKPGLAITPPDGTCLFGGDGINLIGMATEAVTLAPIPSGNLTWYLDGTFWKTNSPNLVAPAEVATGLHRIGLVAVDSSGIASAATSSIYFGYTLPSIQSPASGTQFTGGSNVTFNAVPPSTDTIAMRWYDDGVEFGTGDSVSYAPAIGLHTISYAGTDRLGRGATHTIQILVDDPPTVALSWGSGVAVQNGDIVFGGHAYSMIGAGTQSTNLPVPSANLKWYLDGAPWKTGTNVNIAAGELATGSHRIALWATDELGLEASVTRTIFIGYPVSEITSPASGTRVDTGIDTTFTAVPDSSGTTIVMNWYWDETNAFGTGESATTNAIASGRRTITYVGTDSADFESLNSMTILVNRLPTATALIVSPAQYATAPGDIPIFIASPGIPIVLNATGTDYELGGIQPAASLSWYFPPGNFRTTGASLSLNIENPGTQTVVLTSTDNFGSVATTTIQFWVWDAEIYDNSRISRGLSNPTGIVGYDLDTVFVANASNSEIVKFKRGRLLTASGDLMLEPDPATVSQNLTAGGLLTNSLITISGAGDSVYSLEMDIGAGTSRIKRFAAGDLAEKMIKPAKTYQFPLGGSDDQLDHPTDMQIVGNVDAVEASVFYIADRANGRVVKWDIPNDAFYSKKTGLSAPAAVRFNASDQRVYILEQGLGRISVYDKELNTSYTSYNIGAPGASFCISATKIYATDPASGQIVMFDMNGNTLYRFGRPGTQLGEFSEPWGIAVIENDLYVVERGNNRVQRIRGGSW